jgi:DNA-directed RNA polymerase subunit RPC12/RpoP
MARAICTNQACSKLIEWRAQRGAKLSEIRCPECGSKLLRFPWGICYNYCNLYKTQECTGRVDKCRKFAEPEKFVETVWPCDYCKHKADEDGDNLFCDEGTYTDRAPIGVESTETDITALISLMEKVCPGFGWFTDNMEEVQRELKKFYCKSKLSDFVWRRQ